MVAFTQQPFAQIQLDDSIKHVKIEIVNFNNDRFRDIVLLMESETQRHYVGFIPGDTLQTTLVVNNIFETIFPIAYSVTDYDRNNFMDILISGEREGVKQVMLYRNDGNFQFTEAALNIPPFTLIKSADLDNDGVSELIAGDETNTKIFKRTAGDQWTIVHDSLKIKPTAIQTLDANGDELIDLFVSGVTTDGKHQTLSLINRGKFFFVPETSLAVSGEAFEGDLDHDGFKDILVIGTGADGNNVTKSFLRQNGGYIAEDHPVVIKQGDILIADFNSDGLADISFQGESSSGVLINEIRYTGGNNIQSFAADVIDQKFGDLTNDGVLDIVTATAINSQLTVTAIRLNDVPRNDGPKRPEGGWAVRIFDRVFLTWEKPLDDHTATNVLTYDVFINGTEPYVAGEFDLMNNRRLTVTHGNNGTRNFKLLKHAKETEISFAVQAVDNAFNGGPPCIAAPGNACVTQSHEALSLCSKEVARLNAPDHAQWYSLSRGYLGEGSTINFSTTIGDTIFYFIPKRAGECSLLKTWTIEPASDTVKTIIDVVYNCADAAITFTADPGWQTVSWASDLKGELGDGNSIQYTVTANDSVRLTLIDGGCTIQRTTAVRLSKPSLQVAADQFQIAKGGEVQLTASGAQRYHWTPSAGLNDPEIADPIASPLITTQYVVTGYDSLDCVAQLPVSVIVEEAGFIPTLFSPNDDGQNDHLKVYGLVSASRFSLSIFNREGALVYKTTDLSEASSRGWDGSKNGTAQPPGVYFWKVEGELPSGQLLLNGKKSGSVVLIR